MSLQKICLLVLGLLSATVVFHNVSNFSVYDRWASEMTVLGDSSVRRPSSAPDIHICFCSDDIDLRPAVAAIRSILASTADPSRIMIHFITSRQIARYLVDIFRLQLPGARFRAYYSEELQKHIANTITFRSSSGARQSLASPFNFAPFYLQDFLQSGDYPENRAIKRAIYMDCDVIVMGDVAELHQMDLQGHSCAAVPYCDQRLQTYINFTQVARFTDRGPDPDACVANRGIIVVDFEEWRSQQITQKIELWMDRYRKSSSDLWAGGMSQPPWLLALNGKNYAQLDQEWNCNGLGRSSMSEIESKPLFHLGFDEAVFELLNVTVVQGSILTPYVATCSSSAKLLHYNGAMKPWLLDPASSQQRPVCSRPQSVPYGFWARPVVVHTGEETGSSSIGFVSCAEIWSKFVTASSLIVSDRQLNEVFRERKADEQYWANELKIQREKRRQEEERRRIEEEESRARYEELKKQEKKKESAEREEKKKHKHKQRLAGGFSVGQEVVSNTPIVVRGRLVVEAGTKGIIMGPAMTNPTERIHVLWKNAERLSVNVVPQEIGLAVPD